MHINIAQLTILHNIGDPDMQIVHAVLLLSSLPLLAADTTLNTNKKDSPCLKGLQNFPAGKNLLRTFAQQDLPTPTPQLPEKSKVRKTNSDVTSNATKQKQERSLRDIFRKKSHKAPEQEIDKKETNDRIVKSLKESLQLNTFLADIYGEEAQQFVCRAHLCIERLEECLALEKSKKSPLVFPSAQEILEATGRKQDEEMERLLEEIKEKESNSLKKLIEAYKQINSQQRGILKGKATDYDATQIAIDSSALASNLHNTVKPSCDLFDTIDLILMRAIEILIHENQWNREKFKHVDNLLVSVDHYRRQSLKELGTFYPPRSPLKIDTIRGVLDTQKRLLTQTP